MNQRNRTNNIYNLNIDRLCEKTKNFWQMPIIQKDDVIPHKLMGFNYARSNKNKDVGIHFYLDDYQFERVWKYPDRYVEMLQGYECVLSPDFSLYRDMPMAMKMWNTYRSRLIGAHFQKSGIKVIPTISWADSDTFSFCFEGIPEGSIVSVSTIGVKRNGDSLRIWHEGMTEMEKRIKPSYILVYGGKISFECNAQVLYFENEVTEKWN